MPDGMYLDARILGPKKIAKQMRDIIHDKQNYYEYFKWHNHYIYHDTRYKADTNDYCNLCVLVNDFKRRTNRSAYKNLAQWWNVPHSAVIKNRYHSTSLSNTSTKVPLSIIKEPSSDPTFADVISLTLKFISNSYENNTQALLDLISKTVANVSELQKLNNKAQYLP